MQDYSATLSRVEDYFDRSATKVWERLTSDAPVSRIRQTVREGRDRMRAIMLSRLALRLDWTLYTAFVADERSPEYRALTAGLAFSF